MPLEISTGHPAPGPSRKRTHAEITKSESRSPSPFQPHKRRRTTIPPSHPRSSPPVTASFSVGNGRLARGSFDYRRPMMSTTDTSRPHTQNTIDLTLEDDTPPPATTTRPRSNSMTTDDSSHTPRLMPAAPPFGRTTPGQVIDLSLDDDEDEDQQLPQTTSHNSNRPPLPPSPEVQFLRERALPEPRGMTTRRGTTLPEPVATGVRDAMARFLQSTASYMLPGGGRDRGLSDQIDNMIRANPLGNISGIAAFQPEWLIPDTNYDDLQMDYTGAGFNMDGDLIVEEPPPRAAVDRDYKAPPAPQEGYLRTYEEDDMLVCGFCGDELATGADEVKQQVWVVKQCGHVYCGGCAGSRMVTKEPNNKQRKANLKVRSNSPFKTCKAPGCNKNVTTKTAMFQIYL